MKKGKPIDKVTTINLDSSLRMVGITLDHKTIDKIIDLVELPEEKGDALSIKDICELKESWNSLTGESNVLWLDELKDIPVEVVFEDNTVKKWRAF